MLLDLMFCVCNQFRILFLIRKLKGFMCELKHFFFERLYSFDGDAFSLTLTAY